MRSHERPGLQAEGGGGGFGCRLAKILRRTNHTFIRESQFQ
jgi:hypothetical protein